MWHDHFPATQAPPGFEGWICCDMRWKRNCDQKGKSLILCVKNKIGRQNLCQCLDLPDITLALRPMLTYPGSSPPLSITWELRFVQVPPLILGIQQEAIGFGSHYVYPLSIVLLGQSKVQLKSILFQCFLRKEVLLSRHCQDFISKCIIFQYQSFPKAKASWVIYCYYRNKLCYCIKSLG